MSILANIKQHSRKKHAWSGVMEFALKHIFARDVFPHIKNITNLLAQLDQSDGREFVDIVLQYFLERGELKNREKFFELISDIMTLAEQLKEEGQQERALKIARNLLNDGAEPAFVAKVTRLSLPVIKNLKKNN
jgi:recombination-promoting nuclease RpnB